MSRPRKYNEKDIENMKEMEKNLLSIGLPRYIAHKRIGEKYGLSGRHVCMILTPGQTLRI